MRATVTGGRAALSVQGKGRQDCGVWRVLGRRGEQERDAGRAQKAEPSSVWEAGAAGSKSQGAG